jgi:hypothetical protein
MTRYVIQPQGFSRLCLTVEQGAAGAPVVLGYLQGPGSPFTHWELDPNSGVVTSIASLGQPTPLVLDVAGTSPQDGTPVLIDWPVLGRPYQAWNWIGNAPFINNNGAARFALAVEGVAVAGARIVISAQQNGNLAAAWTIVAVAALQRQVARAARSR